MGGVMALYHVPIIGDGLTTETGFRPDVPADIAFVADILLDELGQPISDTCLCEVADEDGPRLLAHNPLITPA